MTSILLIYQPTSIQELNGQNVNLSKKSEINHLVVHAGPSELLKQCLIEFVLLLDKLIKQESQLLIYVLAVLHVEMDVKEVILQQLGTIIKIQV